MIDKTTNSLLAVIAAALCLLLLRGLAGPTPAQAQSPTVAMQSQPVIATDKGVVYVLQNGTLSVYLLDSPMLEKMLPEATKVKLRLVNSVKVQTAP
jgi:hypothetical protein